jgi:hypothetical protein
MPKVLLTRDGGVIVAKKYTFVEGHGKAGIAALRDDGANEFFVEKAFPTYKDYYKIDVADDAGFAAKKRAVLAVTGWLPEEYQWADIDENGGVVPGTDTDERLTAWLNAEIDEDLLDTWGGETSTAYAPGFVLMQSLSEQEIKKLDMREGNLGGPVISVPCVFCHASLEELNDVIARKDLPFIFVDDEGSEEIYEEMAYEKT